MVHELMSLMCIEFLRTQTVAFKNDLLFLRYFLWAQALNCIFLVDFAIDWSYYFTFFRIVCNQDCDQVVFVWTGNNRWRKPFQTHLHQIPNLLHEPIFASFRPFSWVGCISEPNYVCLGSEYYGIKKTKLTEEQKKQSHIRNIFYFEDFSKILFRT